MQLPYTGVGSGIRRALETDKRIIFKNDKELQEFLITIECTFNQPLVKSNQESNQESGSNILGKQILKMDLTQQQKDIRNYCFVPRTAQEIMDRIGVSNQSKNR